jgi:hypothetical protein
MTTLTKFSPGLTANPPFQFSATLDGNQYTISVTWNFAAQRYYIQITDQFGNTIVTRPMIGSPALQPLLSLEWQSGIATAMTASIIGLRIGALANITVTSTDDNGIVSTQVFPSTVISHTSFTYPLVASPWVANYCPRASWSIDENLAGGFFQTSLLFFRQSTQNFETTP